jgi:hypothetical protein|uniref:Dimeris T4 recombination endonuclease VII n=1 Tax=Siphoviridae sp. ctPJ52 TaxID=2825483 RepID=A0A8S5USD5_9CAUD|nr:MAG TPA: dimeris T4 recombination endonuclease VII [Siphoviridae sp. ctPJ52]
MRYFNTLTKATIDTEFKISGGDWVLEDELEKVVVGTDDDTQKEVEQVSEETTGDEKYDSITKAQIMQELDAFGIEYDKKSTKRVLYDLMLSQGE